MTPSLLLPKRVPVPSASALGDARLNTVAQVSAGVNSEQFSEVAYKKYDTTLRSWWTLFLVLNSLQDWVATSATLSQRLWYKLSRSWQHRAYVDYDNGKYSRMPGLRIVAEYQDCAVIEDNMRPSKAVTRGIPMRVVCKVTVPLVLQ